jgi:hypothetical protein
VEVAWSEVVQVVGDEKGRCDRRDAEWRIGPGETVVGHPLVDLG